MNTFGGFRPESIEFLIENKKRNSKPWFEDHRDQYEILLLNPFRQLVQKLTPAMLAIDPDFDLRPAINRTISKLYRDTRFSNDKSLFRDSMWLVFRKMGEDWKTSAPAFYFEIMPHGYRYGMGFYDASRAVMDKFREAIDENTATFKKVIAFLQQTDLYTLNGDLYKRPLPADHPPEIQTWYQRKSFYLSCDRSHDYCLYSGNLPGALIEGFEILGPLYRFIIKALNRN
ncbi:DUF2461 domain-containing protein [candidate division KSB1 bacterium]|nr:DUF2461 domain-containing protein [candidate division KSB1 bacterium]